MAVLQGAMSGSSGTIVQATGPTGVYILVSNDTPDRSMDITISGTTYNMPGGAGGCAYYVPPNATVKWQMHAGGAVVGKGTFQIATPGT